MPNQYTKRPISALERFAKKCAFDPTTGCVIWCGARTSGHGHNEKYGSFYYEKYRWLAHRWSARYIHKMDIEDLQVDHCCPAGPLTLCVEHVRPEIAAVNRELQQTRPGRSMQGLGRAYQSLQTRQYWLYVWKGIEERPERIVREDFGVPWFEPPAWLVPFMPKAEDISF